VRVLATDAYTRKDAVACATAERLLYAIQVANAFAPPMHGAASIVWNILIRAKLGTTLRPHLSAGCTIEDMKRQVDAGVREAQQTDHLLFDTLAATNGMTAFIVYGKNWEAHVFGFVHQLVSLTQRTTGPLQKMVAKMIVEEFLPAVDHDNLRGRLMERIGLDVSKLDRLGDPDITTESLSVMNYRTAVTLVPNPYFALGSFYSIEAAFPDVCARMLVSLRRQGFDEHSLEYLSLHGEADVHHSSEWMDALQACPLTAYQRACVVAGALGQLELRHRMFESIRHVVTGRNRP
jgi:pyrroloquinoline quinone (PQQ) biosynthesis protein C